MTRQRTSTSTYTAQPLGSLMTPLAMIPLPQRDTAYWSVSISHFLKQIKMTTHLLSVRFLLAFYYPSPLVKVGIALSLSDTSSHREIGGALEFSLIVVDVLVVLYSSSLEPKLELSYPPSGNAELPSWLQVIAFRTLQSEHHCFVPRSVNPIVLTSILPPVTKSPFRQILISL